MSPEIANYNTKESIELDDISHQELVLYLK